MNTPAVTMVAAWMSAETGVGPSIASGSQVCSRNCADLPIAPMNSRQQKVSVVTERRTGRRNHRRCGRGHRRDGGDRTSSSKIVPNNREDADDAEREAEIADAVDDEGLDRRGVGEGFWYQKPISR